jgi:hypothetical protein
MVKNITRARRVRKRRLKCTLFKASLWGFPYFSLYILSEWLPGVNEAGEWKLGIGNWQRETGNWKKETGNWKTET